MLPFTAARALSRGFRLLAPTTPAWGLASSFPRRYASLDEGGESPTLAGFKTLSMNTQRYEVLDGVAGIENFNNIAATAFSDDVAKILMAPLDPLSVEIKPDGMLYLPEIKYRRIMNQAFGPGGWALKPVSPPIIISKSRTLSREYALYAKGQFVSHAVGEQSIFENAMSEATCIESAKSNALVRCCKDLGVASELWDPQYLIEWRAKYSMEVWCEHARSKERKKLWRRRDRPPFEYPYKEVSVANRSGPAPLPRQPEFAPAFDKPEETSAEEEATEGDFNPDEVIPAAFKKFAGKTWREVFEAEGGRSYLNYMKTNSKNKDTAATAGRALDWLAANS